MDIPQCSLCYIVYHADEERKPRFLLCGHTFCTKCLKNMIDEDDNTIKCPNRCLKVTKLSTCSISDDLTINYDQLKNGLKYCFNKECENMIVDRGIMCSHCGFKYCYNCMPLHFADRKKTLLTRADLLNHKFERLLSNIQNINSHAISDLEWSIIYRDKHVNKIKNPEKKTEVSKKVELFCAEMKKICDTIEIESKKLHEKDGTIQEIKKQIESIDYDSEILETEENCLQELNIISKKIDELETHRVEKVHEKIDLEKDEYLVENPIVTNKNEWIRLELDIAGINQNFNPDSLFEMLKRDSNKQSIQIAIGIIGRSGVGKSSFLNAFFGFKPQDEKYIKTDFVECMNAARPYYVDKERYENFMIWDTPGVGTINFELKNYENIIKRIECDAFVYLYEVQFNEVDQQVLKMLRQRTHRIFICRTKVDNDYKRVVEKKEKRTFNQLKPEKRELYMSESSDEYKETFKDLKEKYESNRKEQNIYLKNEKLIFYLSNKESCRHMFEFDEFLRHLYESLPKVQGDIIIDEIKTRSLDLLEKKKKLIESEIEGMVFTWVRLCENWSDYKKWLNGMLQEYARRLALERLFKEIDEDQFESMIRKIEANMPVRMEAIRNQINDNGVSSNVKTNFKTSLFFTIRNLGARKRLHRETCIFLKQHLNTLYEHARQHFSAYYKNKNEIND